MTMAMNRIDGTVITGAARLAQSIMDIVTTPLSSRIMRREYGCLLHQLLDAPINGQTRLLMAATVATAIVRWEPEVKLTRVRVSDATAGAAGALSLDIEGQDLTEVLPSPFRLSIPLGA